MRESEKKEEKKEEKKNKGRIDQISKSKNDQ